MDGKQALLANLRGVFGRWEKLLASRTERELTAKSLSTEWSTRDVIVHLMAWQQISIARVEAALENSEPEYPAWLAGADPFFAEEHTGEFNARIQDIYRNQSWQNVHRAWREGFLRFVELAESVPEETMLDPRLYPWLDGYALSAVLQGSCEHHEEHLETSSRSLG